MFCCTNFESAIFRMLSRIYREISRCKFRYLFLVQNRNFWSKIETLIKNIFFGQKRNFAKNRIDRKNKF